MIPRQSRAAGSLRRVAVALAGHGPKRVLPAGVQYPRATMSNREPGQVFSAPNVELVGADIPAEVATWPRLLAREPDRYVVTADNAGLYDDDGVVYDIPSRAAYPETLHYFGEPPGRHPVFSLRRGHKPTELPGTSVFIGGAGGQTFFHFLIESLPQVALLGDALSKASRLIVQGYLEPQKMAWLRHLGITAPVQWLNALDHLQCERLVFTSRLVTHYHPNPWSVRTLRTMFKVDTDAGQARSHRIWIDRRAAHVRPVRWESELVAQLPDPWEPVDFARLTPTETIRLCRECSHVAGFHGAGLANTVFCPPGTRILEAYESANHAWYPVLSTVAGHSHRVYFTPANAASLLRRLNQDS